MKIILFFISFILSHNLFGQAKQLNELLKRYAFNDFRWKEQPPVALQNSRELVVPHVISRDTLQVIKWKDIDSARIFDFSSGSVRIVLYGKVVKYQKCKPTDSCSIKYFDSSYNAGPSADSIFIPLILKTNGKEPAFSNKMRKCFKEALYQLNHTSVSEYYQAIHTGQTVFYNRKRNEIIICYDCSNDRGSAQLYAKNLRNAKKLTLGGLIYEEHSLVISSFELYIGKEGIGSLVFNSGEKFNDELLQMLKTIEPGTSFIFDQIRVQAPDGSIRTIQSPGFTVK